MNPKMRFVTFFSLLFLYIFPARAGLILTDPLRPVDSNSFDIVILGTECRDRSQELVEYSPETRVFRVTLVLVSGSCPEQGNPAANSFRVAVGPLPVGEGYTILYQGLSLSREPLLGEQNALSFGVTKQHGVIDSPKEQEILKGVGVIKGWVCEGNVIEASVDDQPRVPVAYRQPRPDTTRVCFDSNNGFELSGVNWNRMGAGPHTLHLFSDGVEFASTRVVVRPEVKGRLETPSAGSDESGIGLIGGWVCDADEVTVLIDGFPTLNAIYGSPRSDTRSECGDDSNGFGLVMNWGLLGDGRHSMTVFADGIKFGSATFSVKTFGTAFFKHASEDFRLSGFPDVSKDTIIRWSQPHQKFMTTAVVAATGPVEQPQTPVPVDNDQPQTPAPTGESPIVQQGELESPQNQEVLSGMGDVRGWVCEAEVVEASIDDLPNKVPLSYLLSRPDTQTVCGDSDNGFGLSGVNWDNVSAGPHTIHVFADGVEFASVGVTVQPLEPKNAEVISVEPVAESIGANTKQGSSFAANDIRAVLETPVQVNPESGIGVIQGWACDANRITIKIDGGAHIIDAIYGVERSDTESVCGDQNNGFGLVINWGLIGDGEHTVQALADGIEFGSARFPVQTFGVPFLLHEAQDFRLSGFPETGRTTTVRWTQAQQNFVVIDVQ